MKKAIFNSLIVFAICAILFCWQKWGQITLNSPIDAIRFSNYGAFLGGIFGTLGFFLLIITFRKSQEQSSDNSFFNLLQIHESIVRELRLIDKEKDDLYLMSQKLFENNFCDTLQKNFQKECHDYQDMKRANDFFEMLYRILHIRYKYKNENALYFYRDYNWRIGHFLKSFISIMEFICISKVDKNKKDFYVRVFTSRSTWDEKRLVFYFLFSLENDKDNQYKYAKMYKELNIWDDSSIPFILENEDKIKFENILRRRS